MTEEEAYKEYVRLVGYHQSYVLATLYCPSDWPTSRFVERYMKENGIQKIKLKPGVKL